MNEYEKAWFEQKFELDFLKLEGESFQDFFSTIMERCYPGDFIRTRPWGRLGDKKNDGYLSSKRMLFQVYAPHEIKDRNAIQKIEEDFNGALPYWKDHFTTWAFVHNQAGLGPHITKTILKLKDNHVDLTIMPFGYSEFLQEFRCLKLEDLISLFGAPPTIRNMQELRIEDISSLLSAIERGANRTDIDVRPVPPQKLDANALSEQVKHFLNLGMFKTDLIRTFLERWHDPLYGDRLAQVFRQEYLRLKSQGISSDEIFWELQTFISGRHRKMPTQESAALTILAYFFEACDIFEAPITFS